MASHRRINITLPHDTIQLMDKIARRGERSFLISEAVRHYVAALGKTKLRRMLKEGALRNTERDLRIAEDWASLDVDEAGWRESRD